MTHKLFFFVTLIALVALSIFGLPLFVGQHHELGCPFMPGEQLICDMSVFAHITAWQRTLLVTVAQFAILFFWVIFSLNYSKSKDPLIYLNNLFKKACQSHKEFDLYLKLFSKGILHPKIP